MTTAHLVLSLAALTAALIGLVSQIAGTPGSENKIWLGAVAVSVFPAVLDESMAARVIWALGGVVAASTAYLQWHAAETARMNPTTEQEN